MAPGMFQFINSNIDPGTGQPIPPQSQAIADADPLVMAILDEVQASLKADAIALIHCTYPEDGAKVEIGRGSWRWWTGSSFELDAKTQALVASHGMIDLKHGKGWNLPWSSSDNMIQRLYHTPLFTGDSMMGAIWVGGRPKPNDQSLRLLGSLGNLLTDTVYKYRNETVREGVSPVTLQSLVRRLSTWDMPTFNHSLRTVPWVKATALALDCSDDEVQAISWAALLHDIGKTGIPKNILHKPGPLNEAEWELMRLHPGIGARLVASVPRLVRSSKMIESHHEKFDGSGYPYGLSGTQIPLGGRIIAVVDAYAAMTEERAYKMASTHEEAIAEILDCSGTHFDPRVSAAFVEQFK